MSKLSFRARALDNNKPMPIFVSNEVTDLTEISSQSRSVVHMPTGMEKEEESEHHLQRAISAKQVYGDAQRLIIPTPEAKIESSAAYSRIYGDMGKCPKQFIRMQTLGLDDDIPDYDMDSEDAEWVARQSKNQSLTCLQFEDMMDKLEKGCGNQVLSLQDAQALLHGDDGIVIAVYDYWIAKRLRLKRSLIPTVKTEKRDGSSANDPYVGFRRRTEKMQTRKNRKNDESSYEKMLKLKRDITRALGLLKLIEMREKNKRDIVERTSRIFEKRYEVQDWNGVLYNQYLEQHKVQTPVMPPLPAPFASMEARPSLPLHPSQGRHGAGHGHGGALHRRMTLDDKMPRDNDELWTEANERQYNRHHSHHQRALKKLKPHKRRHSTHLLEHGRLSVHVDGDDAAPTSEQGGPDDDLDIEGLFLFKRRKNVQYSTPCETQGGWPWDDFVPGSAQQPRSRYQFTCLSMNRRFLGHARRRIGRGGRIFIDRASTQRHYPAPFESDLRERDYALERRRAVLENDREEPEWTHYVVRPSVEKERFSLYNYAREGATRLAMSDSVHPTPMYPSHDHDSDVSREFALQNDVAFASKFHLSTRVDSTERFLTDLAQQESEADMEIKDDPSSALKLSLEPWKDEALPESIFDDMSNGPIEIRSSLDLPASDPLAGDSGSSILNSLGSQDAFSGSFADSFGGLTKRGLLGDGLEVKSMMT